MGFLTALQFLTTLPVQRRFRPEDMPASIPYFPLVGVIIGLILGGLNWLFSFIFPDAVVNVLLIAAMVAITGAMHLDGFADTCDGLAGHKPAEERLSIMRDSRSGAFAVVGVAMMLLIKYVTLNSIPARLTTPVLLLMPVASRWAMTYAITAYPYARPAGLGRLFKEGAKPVHFVVSTLIAVGVALLLAPIIKLSGLAVLLVLWLATLVVAAYLRRKFGGLTGDSYGAINEIGEVGVFIIVLVLYRFQLI